MNMRGRLLAALLVLFVVTAQAPSICQSRKKHPPTKGQGQLVGGDGQFGEIYTLKNNFNFVIYHAKYTLAPYESYSTIAPKADEKIFEFDIAFKNVAQSDNFLNQEGMFTLVDSTGQLYGASNFEQDSQGVKGYFGTLKPGQGVGQPALKDNLHSAAVIPGKARIVKILVNVGRKFVKPEESLFRYYIAGATREEAGKPGNPKNKVAPLSPDAADPSDKYGAVALAEGKGTVGEYLPSWITLLKLNSAVTTTEALLNSPPPDGKKYVVLNITAKCVVQMNVVMFYVEGGNDTQWYLMDSDGERYRPDKFLKASANEEANHTFEMGDEYTFRVCFTVPKSVTIKKVVISSFNGRKWAFDGSVIQ